MEVGGGGGGKGRGEVYRGWQGRSRRYSLSGLNLTTFLGYLLTL